MTPPDRQCGMTLIEVLVAIVVAAIGLLGMVALQMRAYAADSESYQRASAVMLLQDMVARINSNRAAAATYAATNVGVGPVQDCTAVVGASAQDLCQWGNLLRGAAEQSAGNNVGAMLLARGCITTQVPPASAPASVVLIVAVAWQGVTPTGAPASTCGQGAYSSEKLRRAATAIVEIGTLS